MNLDIKFQLNKKLDKEIALNFLNIKASGVDFSRGVIDPHPELKNIKSKNNEERKEIIDKYFDKFYEENSEKLENEIIRFKDNWSKIEEEFIIQLNKIFKNPTPPEGKYIGYLSIVNCNPRFLHNKTFQIFRNHNSGSNHVAMHEILHFFFYDYAVNKYPEIFSKLDTNTGIFWTLAELFNGVILALLEFTQMCKSEKVKIYPDHEEYIDKVKEFWDDNSDIDDWLIKSFDYINKELSHNH